MTHDCPSSSSTGLLTTSKASGPHEPQHHRERHQKLTAKIHRLSRELRDTTPGNCTMLAYHGKSENGLDPDIDYAIPRPSPPEPSELAQIGASFNGLGGEGAFPPGFQRPRHAERERRPLTKDVEEGYWRPRMSPGSLPFAEHMETTGAIYTDHLHRQSLHTRGGSGYTPQLTRTRPDLVDMPDPSPESSTQTLATITPRPQQHAREYPDFFYAANEERYEAYKYECSRYYQDFPEFMRRGLEKHKNHIEQEGISQKDFSKAMRVPRPRGKLTEEKIEDWYLQTRFNFFGTSLDEPIKECENPGVHELEKGKRSRDKNGTMFETPAKRPKVAQASPEIGRDMVTDPLQSAPIAGVDDRSAIQYQFALPTSQPQYQQHLADFQPSHSSSFVRMLESFDGVSGASFNNMAAMNQLDSQNLHIVLAQDIQKIHANLSMINQSLLADSTANHSESQTKRFQLTIHQIGQCIDKYLRGTYSIPVVTPGGSSQYPAPFDGLTQHMTGNLSPYQQVGLNGMHMPAKNPMLTPGASSGYNVMDTSQQQDYFSFG